jgi:phage shock protein PspC (stress-responsive transcriptional regulator)
MAPRPAREHPAGMSEITTQPIATKRLERPASGRILAGVAAGLGRYFDLSPTFFRLGFIVLTLLGGSAVLLYLAALLIIPEEGKENSIAADALASRRDRPGRVVALGLVAIALFVLISRAAFWPAAGAGWVLILIAGLVILWMYDARRGDSKSRKLLKALFVICVLGFVALLASLVTALAWFHVHPGAGVGTRDETPTTLTQLQPSYHLGVGDLRLDLRQLPLVTHETHIKVRVDVGNLRVFVAQNQPVVVHAHAKVGDVRVFQEEDSGHNATLLSGTGELVIDATVGAGKIEVSHNGF